MTTLTLVNAVITLIKSHLRNKCFQLFIKGSERLLIDFYFMLIKALLRLDQDKPASKCFCTI